MEKYRAKCIVDLTFLYREDAVRFINTLCSVIDTTLDTYTCEKVNQLYHEFSKEEVIDDGSSQK